MCSTMHSPIWNSGSASASCACTATRWSHADAVAQIERRSLPAERDEEGGEGWAVRIDPVGEWLAVSRRQLPAVREAIARP